MTSKRMLRLLVAAVGLITAFAMLSPAAQAATPKPGYTQFKGCPTEAELPGAITCLRSEIKSGHFQMGTKDVPIEKPIVLTGGVEELFTPVPVKFNSEGGLTKAKQKVPGGVIGLTGLTWLAEFLGIEALTLYATTELAGTPVVAGTAFAQLPVKVHLENSTGVLGSKCYVGSSSSPIVLNLTTGTTAPPKPNSPISGSSGVLTFVEHEEIAQFEGVSLVDNAWSAPAATGCGGFLVEYILDPIINASVGVPSAAGTNTAIQEKTRISLTEAEAVNAH